VLPMRRAAAAAAVLRAEGSFMAFWEQSGESEDEDEWKE
jgi:hypothetical protein